MPRLHCGAPKTIDAHLIPKAVVSEVKANPGEQYLILHHDARPTKSHTGVYDRAILCGDCDSLLGRREGSQRANGRFRNKRLLEARAANDTF